MMSHEKLDVYQLSIKFLALVRKIVNCIPRGNADLTDQLNRAARSIPLLIAEGAGKNTPKHQSKYYSDARGESLESAACLDVMSVEGLIKSEYLNQGKQMLKRMVSMLTKMCR